MSKQKWAGIVYGRTYNLDFRFIAIPEDFSQPEISWASEYILATTRNARKLSASPRWSLFKNNSHCVVGVTCMVRDLIGSLNSDAIAVLSKDNRGRPLYVFVGYVTQLKQKKYLLDLPGYTGEYLGDFKHLYHYVERVWSIKDYDRDSRKPFISEYQKPAFISQKIDRTSNSSLSEKLNHHEKFPDKVFLWDNNRERNCRLWTTAASFPNPISLCLNIDSQRHLDNLFLNQTLTKLEEFTIIDKNDLATTSLKSENNKPIKSTLTKVIADKVKEDIEITLQHADRVANASQEIIHTLTQPLGNMTENTERNLKNLSNLDGEIEKPTTTEDTENFGFKVKHSSTSDRQKRDWF